MANELIDLRGETFKAMTKDFNEKVITPIVEHCRANGMTDEEINLEVNRMMFDLFRGLHGFPDSHRP